MARGKAPDLASLRHLLGAQEVRTWNTTAVVRGVVVDSDHEAVWVDVEILATGFKARCRLATPYLGVGFGLYVLPTVGAEVLVQFTSPGVPEKDGAVHPDYLHGIVMGQLPSDAMAVTSGADAPDPNTVLLVLSAAHKLVVKKAGGAPMLTVDPSTDQVSIHAEVAIHLDAPLIDLGGGIPIARIGDQLLGTAGPYPIIGTIGSQVAPVNTKAKG